MVKIIGAVMFKKILIVKNKPNGLFSFKIFKLIVELENIKFV